MAPPAPVSPHSPWSIETPLDTSHTRTCQPRWLDVRRCEGAVHPTCPVADYTTTRLKRVQFTQARTCRHRRRHGGEPCALTWPPRPPASPPSSRPPRASRHSRRWPPSTMPAAAQHGRASQTSRQAAGRERIDLVSKCSTNGAAPEPERDVRGCRCATEISGVVARASCRTPRARDRDGRPASSSQQPGGGESGRPGAVLRANSQRRRRCAGRRSPPSPAPSPIHPSPAPPALPGASARCRGWWGRPTS